MSDTGKIRVKKKSEGGLQVAYTDEDGNKITETTISWDKVLESYENDVGLNVSKEKWEYDACQFVVDWAKAHGFKLVPTNTTTQKLPVNEGYTATYYCSSCKCAFKPTGGKTRLRVYDKPFSDQPLYVNLCDECMFGNAHARKRAVKLRSKVKIKQIKDKPVKGSEIVTNRNSNNGSDSKSLPRKKNKRKKSKSSVLARG